jgi:hypothetical protein
MQVTVNIPDDLAARLIPDGHDAARTLLEESAAAAYRDRRLSMEQLRRLLGFETRFDVDTFLMQHSISDYTAEDLDQDLATLKKLKV